VGDVRFCLRQHLSDEVHYYDPEGPEIRPGLFSHDDILYKLKKFGDEREFRVWEIDVDRLEAIEQDLNVRFDDGKGDVGRLLHVTDLGRLIHKIVVAPGSSEAFVESVKALCSASHKTWLFNRIERSSLEH
jgi:hypothetical protein